MDLLTAEEIAQGLLERLRPYCERIEIAGSIRRQRPQINDIDLVMIPRFTSRWSMFAPSKVLDTEFAETLRELVDEKFAWGEKIISGSVGMDGFLTTGDGALTTGSVQVDCYIATAEAWATSLLIRTGSMQHNIFLCQRAQKLGGTLHANGEGLVLPAGRIAATSEEAILAALGLAYIPPERRECDGQGVPIWMKGTTDGHR
jgi:DNA polymerase/3'-5' exonuclease PolX